MTEATLEKVNLEIEGRKFDLGSVVMTSGVACLIGNEQIHPGYVQECLQRHQKGDWGDLCEEDKEINDLGVEDGDRILSSYKKGDITIWIITEWDRSVTTALLPSEY